VRPELIVEATLEHLDFAAQPAIARVQQIAAAGRIRVHENGGGVDEIRTVVHQEWHGAARVTFRREEMQQRRIRVFPIRQRHAVERPPRLLAVVAEWNRDENGGSRAQ
jgi:hypothetical protein